MIWMNNTYKRTNFLREEAEAGQRSRAISEEPFRPLVDPENQHLPQDEYDYIFALQVRTEKGLDKAGNKVREAKMDYRQFAREMWQELVDPLGNFEHPAFQQFEQDLISGLHSIDMHALIYEDVREGMDTLVRKLSPVIRKAILWSKGDISATGYQVLKIKSSQIILDTMIKVSEVLGEEEGRKQFRERTEYMVADDKMGRLREYFEAMKAKEEKPVKVAVVEDSRENLDRVQALLDEVFGDNGVAFEPVWAAYSREGQAYKRKHETGEISDDDYESERAIYNAIDQFSDLQNPRMLERLQEAELIIDFDGVIGDNVRMRNVQSQIISAALEKGRTAYALPAKTADYESEKTA